MQKVEKNKIIFLINLIYFISIWVYYNYIGEKFNYIKYIDFKNMFNFFNFLIGFSIVCIFSILVFLIKDSFTLLIYIIYLNTNLIPALVFNVFNDINKRVLIGNIILLCLIIITQKISIPFIKILKKKISIKLTLKLLSLMCIVVGGIYLGLYYNYFNLKNLLLIDIYITRAKFRNLGNPLLGYLFGVISRVAAPILLVTGLKLEKKKYILISIITLMILFLSGALKSVFFGVLLIVIFYKGDYNKKLQKIIYAVLGIYIFGILEIILFRSSFIINIIRRVFYVPTYLESKYYDYFSTRLTYATHSFFKSFASNDYSPSISRYFGEKVMNIEGLSANIGVIVDGGISFGILGIIFYTLFIVFFIIYIRSLKIDNRYFGLIVLYIYYMNTSILSTLLLTHGMVFFILFSYIFLRNTDMRN